MANEEKMGKLWGEMPPREESSPGLNEMGKKAFVDLMLATFNAVPPMEGREMFIPPQAPRKKIRYSTEIKDYISLHNIQLQIYVDKMEEKLEAAKLMEFDDEASAMAELPPAPELPPLHEKCILHWKRPGDPTGRPAEKTDFMKGIGEAPPHLPFYAVRRQMDAALSVILGNAGFTTSKESAFDYLMDILHTWFKRFTALLRINNDREALTGESVHGDVLQRTLVESGLDGGYADLVDFYETSVLGHHDQLLKRCNSLVEQYEKLRHPVIEPEEEDLVDNLNVADGVEFPDVPVDEEDVLQQVPFEYEELQGALQNNQPDGSNFLKGDVWPPKCSKPFLEDGVASGSRNSSVSQDIFVHSLESTVQSLESTEPMSLPSEVPTDTRSYAAKRDSNKKLKTS